MDSQERSMQLLERLANSLADRDPNLKEFCFNAREVKVVEVWFKEAVENITLKDVDN